MKRKRQSPERIIAKLCETDADRAAGLGIEAICRKLWISPATHHKWRHPYGGLQGNQVKRLKQLEQENRRVKNALAADVFFGYVLRVCCNNGWWRKGEWPNTFAVTTRLGDIHEH